MSERYEIWKQKIIALSEVVGREEALDLNDREIDYMLAIDEDYNMQIMSDEDAVNSMTESQFDTLIDVLSEATAIELELKRERELEARLEWERIFRECELWESLSKKD